MSRRTEPSRSPSSSSRKRSEEHTSELQSRLHLVCRLLLEKKTTQASQLLTEHFNGFTLLSSPASLPLPQPSRPVQPKLPHLHHLHTSRHLPQHTTTPPRRH